jgi:hypothetical protein
MYVTRDGNGDIITMFTMEQYPGQEYVEGAALYVPPPVPLAPLEQIRAIERTPEVADAMQRGSRLVALAYALDDLIHIAASKGQTVTRQQAHDWAMLNDANYKTLYDAEQAIKPLRALV